MTDISDVVLFNGTLAELNSVDPNRQYKIAGTEFVSKEYFCGEMKKGLVQEELRQNGYDGLVHKATVPYQKVFFMWTTFKVEGVPIEKK